MTKPKSDDTYSKANELFHKQLIRWVASALASAQDIIKTSQKSLGAQTGEMNLQQMDKEIAEAMKELKAARNNIEMMIEWKEFSNTALNVLELDLSQ